MADGPGVDGLTTDASTTHRGPAGVDVAALEPWLLEQLPGWQSPLTATLLAGGRSNLTYLVRDAAGRCCVLRRPPLSGVLPSAHDVLREHRILSALQGGIVPIPTMLAAGDDLELIGAPFYLMSYVEGRVVDDAASAEALPLQARARSGAALAEVLGALHTVDVDAVGLGDLGRRDEYIPRQLRRWQGQFEKAATREIHLVARVHDLLAERIPPQVGATIVHGDYRLGNVILDDAGEIRAVLDWELCALGDPLADLGFMLACWTVDDRSERAMPGGNRLRGFGTRAELVEGYARASGRDLSHLDFYVAFAYWRLACILEGVYSRALGGAQADKDVGIDELRERAPLLAELAMEAAARL